MQSSANFNGGVYFICFRLKIATLFGKFVPKNRNCQFKLKIGTLDEFEYEEFNSDVHFCVFSIESILCFGNLFQKSKLFVEAEI